MKKKYVITMLAIILLLAGACSKDTTKKDSSNDTRIFDKGNYTFQISAKSYNDAMEKRSGDYSASFDIVKVERTGDTLNIMVSFLQGCDVNKFDVIWNGLELETYPVTIALIVKRTAENCGTLGDTITQVLSINLVECLSDSSLIKDARILVSNASKKPNGDNSDVTISNKN